MQAVACVALVGHSEGTYLQLEPIGAHVCLPRIGFRQ